MFQIFSCHFISICFISDKNIFIWIGLFKQPENIIIHKIPEVYLRTKAFRHIVVQQEMKPYCDIVYTHT